MHRIADGTTCGCGAIVVSGPCPRCGEPEVLPGDFVLRPIPDYEVRRRRRLLGLIP